MRIETFGRPFRWVLDRAAAGLSRARVPASLLTISGFVLCLGAGVLFGAGKFISAGFLLIPAAACDLLARPLAHRQPRINYFSAFLKSVLHRYADLALFLGLLVYYSSVNRFAYALLTGIAMAGSVLVSYSQARAESLIDRCRVGFWERPERLVLLMLCALLNRMPIALIILAIGPNFTVIHRIWYTWKETEGRRRAAASDSRQSAPERKGDSQPEAGSGVRDLLARAARRGA